MEKIKVLHFYKSFNVYNGLIEILTILAGGMDLDRFDLGVVVFEYDGNSFGQKFEKLGGRIHSLDVRGAQQNLPGGARALRSLLEQSAPHILQTYALKANLYGVRAARMVRVPGVIATEMTLKDIAHSPVTRFRDRLVQPMVSGMLKHCDYFMATSEFIMQQWYSPAHSSKFKVIYPPFNLEKYNEATAVPGSQSPQHGGRQTIACIARLSEEKGVQVLLKAMTNVRASLPEVSLVVAGTGPYEGRLRQLTRELGLESAVRFLGFTANVFQILRDVDLLVIPSRTEGAPMVAVEAMSMGVPIVATNVGGCPELVADGVTGYLVPPNNPQTLTEAVLRALKDRSRSREMGEEGRKRAFEQFHPSVFISRMEEMYVDLYTRKVVGS